MKSNSNFWSKLQHQLARAVYAAVKRESPLAPMDTNPVPANSYLIRSFDKTYLQYIDKAKTKISLDSTDKAICAFDSRKEQNRFSGLISSKYGEAPIQPRRGGLYCTQDARAQMAELLHYAPKSSTSLFGKSSLYNVVLPKCFAVVRAVRNLDVVDLYSESLWTYRFYDRVQSDNKVNKLLKALGYKDLLSAVLDQKDYAASRALGLGLEANPEIEGMGIISARDYETEVDMNPVIQTGNNIVLFKEDLKPASEMVLVTSMHVVDENASGKKMVSHYEAGSSGLLELSDSETLPP